MSNKPKKPRVRSKKAQQCQVLIYDGTIGDDYFECGRPAKAWVKDTLGRSGWGGRQRLCGIHARAYDKAAEKAGRALSHKMKA